MARKFNLSGGLESAAIREPAPQENSEIREADDLVSANETEVANAEVEEHQAEIEKVAEAAEGLESIAASIESTLGSRGLDAKSAMFAHHAIGAYTKRLNMRNPMPAMENFGGLTSQMATTRLGLEDLRTTIKDAWTWLIDLIKKAGQKIAEYYNKVWAMAPRLIKKAEGIVKLAGEKRNGLKPEGSKVEISKNMLSFLHVNKNYPSSLSGELQKVEKFGDFLFVDYVNKVKSNVDALVEDFNNFPYDDDAKFTETINNFIDSRNQAIAEMEALNTKSGAGENTTNFPGNQKVTTVGASLAASQESYGLEAQGKKPPAQEQAAQQGADKGDDKGGEGGDIETWNKVVKSIEGSELTLVAIDNKLGELTDKTISTLANGEISAIAERVIGICTIIMNYKTSSATVNAARDKLIKAAERSQSMASKAEELSADNQKIAQSLPKVIKFYAGVLDQPNRGFCNYMLKLSDVSLQLCEKSLANYK